MSKGRSDLVSQLNRMGKMMNMKMKEKYYYYDRCGNLCPIVFKQIPIFPISLLQC